MSKNDAAESAAVSGEGPIPLDTLRHSAAHVMAEAVQQIWPAAKFGIGPPITDGFYYDFDLPRPLTPDDLAQIERRMRRIIKSNLPFSTEEIEGEAAKQLFRERGQSYKLELIEALLAGEASGEVADSPDAAGVGAGSVRLYQQGKFLDLCGGPHVTRTGQIGSFKLLRVAGAYWRGDENRPQLQRIYGTAWHTQQELDDYLWKLEEARRRDHRRLGTDLGLFFFNEQVGGGLPLWEPNGAILRSVSEDFWKEEHRKWGYEYVYSPHIGTADLWSSSGHLEFFRDAMYAPIEIDQQQFLLKPMNCPFHVQIYRRRLRSYRELPVRYCELGTVYRYERAGVLHGLLRVRGFTQDDSHIFCRPDQLEDEINGVLDLGLHLLRSFGFHEYEIDLSVRDPNNLDQYMGSDEEWEQAEGALRRALEGHDLDFHVAEGEAVFYAPKIDIRLLDSLGRSWQCTTIQVDFNLPERFDLGYIGEDGAEHRPFMVHRALLGSLERFLGTLIEHYGGAFPLWLAPAQAIVLPIADRHNAYAAEVAAALEQAGLRARVDSRSQRIGAKIREAQLQKIPYMLVVGDREAAAQQVAVRRRSGQDRGTVALAEVIAGMQREVQAKASEPLL